MGFFSWNCKHCDKEILAPYPTTKWSNVVALIQGGSVIMGTYDGYGNISGYDLVEDDPEMYHRHCWEEAGKPTEYNEGSDSAPCQGYFIGPNDLNKDYPIEGGWKFVDE
jgi:hypothetical protein